MSKTKRADVPPDIRIAEALEKMAAAMADQAATSKQILRFLNDVKWSAEEYRPPIHGIRVGDAWRD